MGWSKVRTHLVDNPVDSVRKTSYRAHLTRPYSYWLLFNQLYFSIFFNKLYNHFEAKALLIIIHSKEKAEVDIFLCQDKIDEKNNFFQPF